MIGTMMASGRSGRIAGQGVDVAVEIGPGEGQGGRR